MDFIEQIFGMAPDGGSGSLERLLLAVAVVAIVGLMARVFQRRQRRGLDHDHAEENSHAQAETPDTFRTG
jgi:hypothetical protein